MMKIRLLACICLTSLTFAAQGAPEGAAKSHSESVDEVLADYGHLIGKKVLYDNTVQGQIPLPAVEERGDQRAATIEEALFLNGFKLVDVNPDTVAIVGLGRAARGVGVPVYTQPEELPKGQRVVSFLFKLVHNNAQEVAGVLSQYIPPDAATSFTPDKASNTVIATGQTNVIRNVIKVVDALDAPTAHSDKAAPEPVVKSP